MPLLLLLLASMNVATDQACIQGKVLDPVGAPVSSVYVTASSLDNARTIQVGTDSDGEFEIDGLEAGERYAVLASDKPLPGYVRPSSMGEGGAAPTTVVAESECPSLTLRLPARARLLVKATNLLTGEPIKSVHAQFRFDIESSWGGDVEEHGELLVPPDSSIEVQVGAAGYAISDALTITTPEPGQERKVEVALRPVQMGCIAGAVIDEQGSGVAKARIQASSETERFLPPSFTSTDANGRFRIDSVQPGPHIIFVDAMDYPLTLSGGHTRINVPPGVQCADAMIALGPKAAKLRVRVVDSVTQEPVKDAEVWLSGKYTNGGWGMRGIADPTPVPALSLITVHATAEGYVESQPVTVSPMEPEQTQEITIALQPK